MTRTPVAFASYTPYTRINRVERVLGMAAKAAEDIGKPRRLYRAQDFAAQWGISDALAYKLMASGLIKTVRLGRSVRVTQDALDAYLAAHSSGGQ